MKKEQLNKAETLLPEILPELSLLLKKAPDFGSCGIEIIFHEGNISRIISKTEKCHKPKGEAHG